MTSNGSSHESMSLVKQALLAVEQMKAKLEAADRKQRGPIAIVGIGCRFPGQASSPEAFWKLLANGVDAVTRIPAGRWDTGAYYDPNPDVPGKSYTNYGAFLEEIDKFDAQFFNIAPVEAASMDPQQRMLLEVSWEALEHAGLAGEGLKGSLTGIFAGVCSSDYMMYSIGSREAQRVDAFSGTGTASSIATGRLSYFYDFHGPNFPVDTACSSSLLALHLAVQSLRNQECDLALAAGVSAMLAPELYVYFCKTRALSAGPSCRTFDARADGYVRGEGCGVMVLKRLADAQAAGDHIIAVIRGTAVNHDGRTGGLTAPNGPAQQNVIRAALANAGVAPEDVTYIETHGTGTPLGDPIEVQALGAAYRGQGQAANEKLYLGAVKTNIGHLEGAAGIAGAIKAALMLQQRELVPHLHFEQPNPHIAWADLPVEVVTAHQPWPAGRPLIAGVSSFGFSGTNVHVIMEAAPGPDAPLIQGESQVEPGSPPLCVLPLSARSATALKSLAGRYAEHLRQHPAQRLADVCHTAAVGRAHFAHRLAVVGGSAPEMAGQLDTFHSGSNGTGIHANHTRPHTATRVVFQFSGQGAQYPGMGRRLYEQAALYRETLDQCDELLRPQLGVSIVAAMLGESLESANPIGPLTLDETWLTQPALFVFEYALARLWQAWGVEPAAMTGHSIGEYTAACLAGVFSLEDALRLVAARGRLMQALPQAGAMVVAFAPETEVLAVLKDKPDVALAAVNGPDNVVISGNRQSVMAAADELEAAGFITQALRVSHAFHSPLMEPMLSEFRRIAGEIVYRPPEILMISNETGRFFDQGQAPDADYWTRHVRQPVRYYAGLQTLIDARYSLFLEIGPKPILTDLGRRYMADAGHWLASCQPTKDEAALLESLAAVYVHGCPINWGVLYPRSQHRRQVLPTYPFERKRFWLDQPSPARTHPSEPALVASDIGDPSLQNAFVDVLE